MLALGYILFGDWPDHWTLVGSAIVISSGLYLIYRERARKALDVRQERIATVRRSHCWNGPDGRHDNGTAIRRVDFPQSEIALQRKRNFRGSIMTKADVLMTGPMQSIVSETLARQPVRSTGCGKPPTARRFSARSGLASAASPPAPATAGPMAALFDRLPKLEILASFGVGYDNVDVAEAARRGHRRHQHARRAQ